MNEKIKKYVEYVGRAAFAGLGLVSAGAVAYGMQDQGMIDSCLELYHEAGSIAELMKTEIGQLTAGSTVLGASALGIAGREIKNLFSLSKKPSKLEEAFE